MNLNNKHLFIIFIIALVIITSIAIFCTKYLIPKWNSNTSAKANIENNIKITNENNSTTTKDKVDFVVTKTGSKINIVTAYDENMFKGKKSLVFFWASWCSHCVDEIAVIKESMKEYSNKGYNVYAISHDNDIDDLISFMEKENIQFDVYFDKGRIIRKNLDPEANTVPLLYVINEDTSVGKKNDGVASKEKVTEFISYINSGK